MSGRDVYLLRRYLGIGAHQAYEELPAWEVDLLLRELRADLTEGVNSG